jgi:hypothetical protein
MSRSSWTTAIKVVPSVAIIILVVYVCVAFAQQNRRGVPPMSSGLPANSIVEADHDANTDGSNVRQARKWAELSRAEQESAIRADLDGVAELESTIFLLVEEHRKADDATKRAALKRQLTDVVAKLFDAQHELRDHELRRIEAQTNRLRALYQKREALRMEVVYDRVRELMHESEGVGWATETKELPAAPGLQQLFVHPVPSGEQIDTVTDARSGTKKSRGQARENLQLLAMAMQNYRRAHGTFPSPILYGPDGKTPYSWRIALLPYVDAGLLYAQYRFDRPWDHPENKKLLESIPPVYRDPDGAADSTSTAYFQILTEAPGVSRAESDILDGTANTIMLAEARPEVPWTKPEDVYVTEEDPLALLGSRHEGSFLVALYDGSVHDLPEGLSKSVVWTLITPDAGDEVDWPSIRNAKGGGVPRWPFGRAHR